MKLPWLPVSFPATVLTVGYAKDSWTWLGSFTNYVVAALSAAKEGKACKGHRENKALEIQNP